LPVLIGVKLDIGTKRWVEGGIGAFISGATGASCSGLGDILFDSDQLVKPGGIKHLLIHAAISFVLCGAVSLKKYLAQNPVPPQWVSVQEDRRASGLPTPVPQTPAPEEK